MTAQSASQARHAAKDVLPAQVGVELATGFSAIAFDMDGLLVDTEPLWWRAEATVAAQMGGDWTEADSVACVGGPMEKVADIIISRAGQGEPARVITDVIQGVIDLLETEPVQWLPGAKELVELCAVEGIPHALVSASPRPIVNAVLAALGDDASSFAFTISAGDVVRTKPAPDPYIAAAQRFECSPRALMVFEDSPTGTQSALASGAMVVAVPHVGGLAPHNRMHVLTTLAGLSTENLHAIAEDLQARSS
jgi:HAD superfamily hydrolase (TIGR01509 family)